MQDARYAPALALSIRFANVRKDADPCTRARQTWRAIARIPRHGAPACCAPAQPGLVPRSSADEKRISTSLALRLVGIEFPVRAVMARAHVPREAYAMRRIPRQHRSPFALHARRIALVPPPARRGVPRRWPQTACCRCGASPATRSPSAPQTHAKARSTRASTRTLLRTTASSMPFVMLFSGEGLFCGGLKRAHGAASTSGRNARAGGPRLQGRAGKVAASQPSCIGHQSRVLQHPQVLRDRRPAHRQQARQSH